MLPGYGHAFTKRYSALLVVNIILPFRTFTPRPNSVNLSSCERNMSTHTKQYAAHARRVCVRQDIAALMMRAKRYLMSGGFKRLTILPGRDFAYHRVNIENGFGRVEI